MLLVVMVTVRFGIVMRACLVYHAKIRSLADPISVHNFENLVLGTYENDSFTRIAFPGVLESDEWDYMVLDISPICYWLLVSCYWKLPLILRLQGMGGFKGKLEIKMWGVLVVCSSTRQSMRISTWLDT